MSAGAEQTHGSGGEGIKVDRVVLIPEKGVVLRRLGAVNSDQ